jgi:AraC-like DNA-binding protein
MSKRSNISSAYLRSFFQGPISCGIDPQEVMHRCELDPEILSNDRLSISLAEFDRLLSTVSVLLDDEASGFYSRPFKQGTFAMSCHAMIGAPTLRKAIKRNIRFYSLFQNGLIGEITELGEEVTLTYKLENAKQLNEAFIVSSLFIVIIRLASWVIDRPLLLDRINLTFDKPAWADVFDDMFPCQHFFNQPTNSIVFSRKFFDMPNVQTPHTLTEFLRDAPTILLTHYQTDNSLTATIQRMLLKENSVEKLPFEIVAERLFTTTQTLRRRLKEEGNTYQEIKDKVRRNQAIYHLLELKTPISQIVALMGFSEPSAFTRAFKKWTGMTPGNYRDANTKARS